MLVFDCTQGRIVDPLPELPEPLADRQAAMWQQAKALREQLAAAGADTPSGRVQTDPVSIVKINGTATAATAAIVTGAPFAIGFALADNTVVELDSQAAIAMGLAVAAHIAALHAHSFGLRDRIDAAETHAALDAIDIHAGWPS